MCPRSGGRNPTTWRSHEQSLLDEERFVDVFNCFFGFANAYGQGAKPNRAATELLTQVGKHGAVDFVESEVVDTKHRKALVCSCFIDTAIATNLAGAGDYIDGPYPATLEGAVRSGAAAVASIERS